jgi:hypothetical protein
VVDEPADEGGGHHGVAEDLAPLLEAAVGGDGDRAALVAAGDEREEEVGRGSLERQVADLVDDEQVVALEAPELRLKLVAVLRALEPRDSLLRRGECHPVALLARLHPERDARCVLPVPGGPGTTMRVTNEPSRASALGAGLSWPLRRRWVFLVATD